MAGHYQRKVPVRQMSVNFANRADFVPGQEPPHTDRNIFRVTEPRPAGSDFVKQDAQRDDSVRKLE
jgi:hypothetical protein